MTACCVSCGSAKTKKTKKNTHYSVCNGSLGGCLPRPPAAGADRDSPSTCRPAPGEGGWGPQGVWGAAAPHTRLHFGLVKKF